MAALDLFPARVRFVDDQGRLTPAAIRALNTVFERIGGATGPSTTDLSASEFADAGIEEMRHEFTKSIEALMQMPQAVGESFEQLQTELAGLRECVAVLARRIEDMEQGSTYGRSL